MELIEYKKGDLVKIIYLKDSKFNMFKGYFAEVKSYYKDSKSITVSLEAENILQNKVMDVNQIIYR